VHFLFTFLSLKVVKRFCFYFTVFCDWVSISAVVRQFDVHSPVIDKFDLSRVIIDYIYAISGG